MVSPPRRSTPTNFLVTEELITKWLDEVSAVDLTYLDFSKAIDSVDHRLLLDKLRGYGIAPIVISWIESFLNQRAFQVNVNRPIPKGWGHKWCPPRPCQRPDKICHLRQGPTRLLVITQPPLCR